MKSSVSQFSRWSAIGLALTLNVFLIVWAEHALAQTPANPAAASATAPVDADGPKPVIAQAAEPAAKAPVGGPSVILELNDAGTTYKKSLDQARQDFRKVIVPDEKLGALQTAEKKFRDNPNSPQAAADYADAFSDALGAFEAGLRKFLKSRDSLEKDYERFISSTTTAIDAVQKEREHHAQQEAEFARLAQDMETELDRLTVEFQDEIENGEALPPDIDKQVVRLANLIEQRRIAKQLHADRIKRAARNQSKLEQSLTGGQHQMEQLRLRYEKADGDVSLISLIAQSKAVELAPDPVSFGDTDDDEFVVLDFKLFLPPRSDEPEPVESKTAKKSPSLGGIDLLRARLTNRAKDKDNNDAVKSSSTTPSVTTAPGSKK